MKRGKQILCWCALLWKRLYRKLTFVLLLLMIPVLVFGYGTTVKEDSGVVAIALATESSDEELLYQQVTQELMKSQLIRFIPCESPEAAQQMVRALDADAAWVFADDLETKIYDFVAKRTRKNAFVTVYEPEAAITLMMARELLSGVMFPYCSEAMYLTYIREKAPELREVSDETLLEYYHTVDPEGGLFAYTGVDGEPVEQNTQVSYLEAPIRGLLAVVIALTGLATAMYYIQDEKNGTFSWVPERRRPAVELGCQMISVVNVIIAALISLALIGQTVSLGRELLAAVLYSLCIAAFAMAMRRLAGGMRGLSLLTPLLVVMMLAICPVFFDLGNLRQLQFLLPPTYFVNAAYNTKYLGYMVLYTAAMLGISGIADLVKRR